MATKNNEYKIGEFFIENNFIDQSQLNDALDLQKDNPGRRIGEILVTLGALTKEDLVMAVEMYMIRTDSDDMGIEEWLDQDEIDLMMKKLGTP